jgi:hypothetical protein
VAAVVVRSRPVTARRRRRRRRAVTAGPGGDAGSRGRPARPAAQRLSTGKLSARPPNRVHGRRLPAWSICKRRWRWVATAPAAPVTASHGDSTRPTKDRPRHTAARRRTSGPRAGRPAQLAVACRGLTVSDRSHKSEPEYRDRRDQSH